MDLAVLAEHLAAELDQQSGRFGLAAGRPRIEYVLNWGGFVNQSFRVADGHRELHVKLTVDPDVREALIRWHRIHPSLTARYHAPEVLSWIDIAGTAHAGLVFPRIHGSTPDRWTGPLRASVGQAVAALHADVDLRALAFENTAVGSCLEDYVGDFHRRFVEDLEFVREARPAWLAGATLEWMGDEVERLRGRVSAAAAFAEPADALIHGDLWPANVIVEPTGRWHLLDWDDFRVGDPALEVAKLYDPLAADGAAPPADEIERVIGTHPAARERLQLYEAAVLLDRIIDSLADYVAADSAPEHAARVRTAKAAEHALALERYRARVAGR